MTSIPEPNLPPVRPRRSSFAPATPPPPESVPPTPQKEVPVGEGRGAAAPTPATEHAEKKTQARSRRTATADARPAPRPTSTAAKRGAAFSRDILLSVSEEQKARLENTVAWTAPRTGVKSQQAFIRWGIDELCSRLEREYNAGKPFDPIADQST